ncbi:peptidoglycan-binding protein [Curtobacterium sp. ISL-83]|uniref:peptidoglycan-binding domain-containing protein n=1 Tax=Curtobacterium sp. ISL-83 TaxID=2819145 RepID=UPI001BE70F13|nr:hypothetical protein [Curtobacterium sp. ISL-83]MBT2502748.1 hypothetical protein [Curtobacterium sp. ISL-83]
MRNAVSATLVALGAIVAAAGTAAALVVVLPVEPPASLRTAVPVGVVQATEREDADERQVQVTLDTGAPQLVVTSRAGTITSSACSTAMPIRSGDVLATIDGAPVVALATAVPLWRDLGLGDAGDDVAGLQRELARLGDGLAADGILGQRTLQAARAFLVARGIPLADLPDDGVPRAPFSWVPAAENTVQTCSAVVGSPVDADGRLVALPAELRGARIDSFPVDPAPGARVLRLGAATVPVDARGTVASEGLRAIAALPEYDAAVASGEGAPTLTATFALVTPRRVQVVPPTALIGIAGPHACVRSEDGRTVPVEVVGSELGQSFVRTRDERPLDRVRSAAGRDRSCR